MTTHTIERSQINSANTQDRRVALKWKRNEPILGTWGARVPGGWYRIFPEGCSFRVEYLGRDHNCRYLEGTWSNLTAAKAAAEADNNQRKAIKERGEA